MKGNKSDSGNEKICAVLAYLLIGIIWYFVDDKIRKDAFVKFHVKQGIVLLIFAICWSIVLQILIIMMLFPMWRIIAILSYVPLIFAVIGIINALNNKENELPIIGEYGKKFNF